MKRMLCILICLMMASLLLVSCKGFEKVDLENNSGDFAYTIDNSNGAVITSCRIWESELKVPSLIDGHPVKSIGEHAFSSCGNLTSITLPNGLESIGEYAFSNCDSLTSITLPEGVESIGKHAFKDCDSLTSITLSEGVKSIGDQAFFSCDNLVTMTLPNSIETVESNPFEWCFRLTGIWVEPDHPVFAQIDGVLFNKAENKLISYPIGKKSASYFVPDGVKSIGNSAFSFCENLTAITLPEGLESIGNSAFLFCENLTSITLQKGLKSIEDSAFLSCRNLTAITLPEGVDSIGNHAFDDCENLTSITLPASLNSIAIDAFEKGTVLIVPRDSYIEKWAKKNGIAYQYVP